MEQTTPIRSPDNAVIANMLERVAELLELQGANDYRVAAWKNGAAVVRKLEQPLASIAQAEGEEGIRRVTGLGPSLSSVIREISLTGRLAMLSRLEGAVSVEEGLMRVPGVGPTLASKAHRELGIESLEDLEAAAHDGRLGRLPHVGPRRLEMVKKELAAILSRTRSPVPREQRALPEVGSLLAIDALYRRKATQNALPKIAPRRFNPTHERWLPILHTEADGWAFTVLFSNTARAHQRQATHDWVVIYFEKDGQEGQCTVVTELHGPLAAMRVVRGRERECAAWYAERSREQGRTIPAGDGAHHHAVH